VHALITEAPAGGELSPRPGRFTAGVITRGVHFVGGSMRSRANLHVWLEREISVPIGNRTPPTRSCSPQSLSWVSR